VNFSRAGLFVAALAVSAAACGQGPAKAATQSRQNAAADRQPSQQALELARTLAFPALLFIRRTTAAEMRARIERELLSTHLATRGPGCIPTSPECVAVAERIADRHAAEYAQSVNDTIDRAHAQLFDTTMSPAQIRMTLSFTRTDAGQAFAESLRRADTRDGQAFLMRAADGMKLGAPFDEFFEEAKHLPRANLPFAPPPPAAPPPRGH
jgi:hypothetical protein